MRCPAWSSLRTAYSNPLQRESLLAGQIPVTASVERLGPSSYSPERVEDFRGFSGLDRFLTLREDWMTGNPGGSVSGVAEHALPLSAAIFCAPSRFATHSEISATPCVIAKRGVARPVYIQPMARFPSEHGVKTAVFDLLQSVGSWQQKHAMASSQALALQLPCS